MQQQRLVANRYALLAELGRGAMGVVWRAQDQVLGRAVALKELHPPQGIAAEERNVLEERMLREARTAGRLNHPAVVTVYDIVRENDRTYLAMELVDALDLATIVQKHGPRDSAWMAGVALQVLGALEAAHSAGIVHRDVKPSNIMVRPDGAVKLTDFGIAQAMDDPRLTHNGGIVGLAGVHVAGPTPRLGGLAGVGPVGARCHDGARGRGCQPVRAHVHRVDAARGHERAAGAAAGLARAGRRDPRLPDGRSEPTPDRAAG